MDRDDLLKKLRAADFKKNNGKVLRAINVLHEEFKKLPSLKYALSDISEEEFRDCVNYLFKSGYIELRHSESKQPAFTGLADNDYRDLEALLSAKGIQLYCTAISDPLIEV